MGTGSSCCAVRPRLWWRGRARARLALGVDDAHLLDDASAALVHQLAATGSGFVVVTVRSGEPVPDPVVALWKDGLAERVEVQALGRGEVEELITAALGGQVDGAARFVSCGS